MKWDTLKQRIVQALCHQLDVRAAVKGQRNLAAARLLGDLFAGHTLPAPVRGYMEKKHRLGAAIQEAAKDEICRRVDSWDIRGVGRLRELAPEAFPKSLRTGRLVATLDERGDWCVEPALPAPV